MLINKLIQLTPIVTFGLFSFSKLLLNDISVTKQLSQCVLTVNYLCYMFSVTNKMKGLSQTAKFTLLLLLPPVNHSPCFDRKVLNYTVLKCPLYLVLQHFQKYDPNMTQVLLEHEAKRTANNTAGGYVMLCRVK